MAEFFDASKEIVNAQKAMELDSLLAEWLADPTLEVQVSEEPVCLTESVRSELTSKMDSCLSENQELSFLYFQINNNGKPIIFCIAPIKYGYPTCDWNFPGFDGILRKVKEHNEIESENPWYLGYGHFHIPPHGPIFSAHGGETLTTSKDGAVRVEQRYGMDYCANILQKGTGGVISPYHLVIAKSSNPQSKISVGVIEGQEGGKIIYHPIEIH